MLCLVGAREPLKIFDSAQRASDLPWEEERRKNLCGYVEFEALWMIQWLPSDRQLDI